MTRNPHFLSWLQQQYPKLNSTQRRGILAQIIANAHPQLSLKWGIHNFAYNIAFALVLIPIFKRF
jgi:hypothetical protein